MEVRGARKNNLRSVDVDVPIDAFTVVTGVSGSGKTSLAFDTLFSEGQRRFVESLSTYARRYLGRLDKAPVERLDGLGPSIAIDQRASSRSPRSTVATATEIHDYLRLLYARVGRPHCPDHGGELVRHAPSQIASQLAREWSDQRGYVLAPVAVPEGLGERAKQKRVEYAEALRADWRENGFVRALVDGAEHRLEEPIPIPPKGWPELLLVVDRVSFKQRARLVDSSAQAAERGHGRVVARTTNGDERVFTVDRSCPECGHRVPENPHPRYFSFNHHQGACESCAGLGRLLRCDPERLVNHPDLPTFGGAIQHRGAAFTFLTKKTGWYAKIAQAVAKRYGFSLSAPFRDLSPEAQALLLHGCGDERFDVVFSRKRKTSSRRFESSVTWKGLATQIEEWAHGEGGGDEQQDSRYAAVMHEAECAACGGERLARAQRHVTIGGLNLPAFTRQTVDEAIGWLAKLRLRKSERTVADEVLREIGNRLGFLTSVGLGYLTLDRSAATLSGGEAQRIRLATQLGNRLVGVLYVLDEPTVGLHPRDTAQLLRTLQDLRDLGNTVVAVEHDEAMIRAADHVIDVGPGAGHRGGRIVAAGAPRDVARADTLTGRYLRGDLRVEPRPTTREPIGRMSVRGADAHNLRGIDVEFPLGVLTTVTGVSGSGKSSLVFDSLLPRLRDDELEFEGVDELAAVVVDQSPIGTTPSSNPATYTGIFTPIREFFAQLPASKVKGFKPGRFSFNVAGGRCDHCEGKGQIRVEMHFLADVWVTCEICSGRRFNAETLSVEYRGKSISDVLELEVVEALELFGNHKRLRRPLQLLCDVGLGYLKLGQSANTLSGGEAQRIKLVAQLAKRPRGHNVFLLDEPTTGLHMDDVAKLLVVLQRLVDRGDTVVVIEHHLDVIKCADWVIELGPEAGAGGGDVIATGTPTQVSRTRGSHTAPFLREALSVAAAGTKPRRERRARGEAG
ncbi:MAG: excinuclease ABC subunit UvrA [Planctomycetes bacterium]|nr:excinuclease ABC subunit UvrA [Planctomycetota bacterium]